MKYNSNPFLIKWLEAQMAAGNTITLIEKDNKEEVGKYRVIKDGLIMPNGDLYDLGSTFWAPLLVSDVDPEPELELVVVESTPEPEPEPTPEPTPEEDTPQEAAVVEEKPAAKKTRVKK